MNETEYHTELLSILNLTALVPRFNITAVLMEMDRATTIGPTVLPIPFRDAITTLQWHQKLAQAALQFQIAVHDAGPAPRHFPKEEHTP